MAARTVPSEFVLWIDEQTGADPDAPLVVLVHGSMDRSASFARVVRELRDLHVIRYDRRGYGRSVDAGPGTLPQHVEDLVSVQAGRPATIVGHSLGGVIALAAAQRHPDLVRSAAVFEAPISWAPWWPSNSAGAAAAAARGDGDAAAVAESFMRRMIGDEGWEALPARTRAARGVEGAALVAELKSARTPPPPYDLEAIAVPVLVARGSECKAHHRKGADTLAAALEVEVRVIDGATHGGHRSHPVEFAALVRQAVAVAAAG